MQNRHDTIPTVRMEWWQANTQLLNVLGADSVPFILSKNKSTGQVITHSGAMETAALAEFLGV
jgi:thiol:disulfide interchange protein DsbG